MGDWLFMHWFPASTSFYSNNSLYHKKVQITPINLELAAFQKHGGPRISFFLIVLTRSNFDHYTRECGFGILKKKTKHVVRPTAWRPLSGQLLCPPWGERTSPFRGRVRVSFAWEVKLWSKTVYSIYWLFPMYLSFSEWCDPKRVFF